MSLLTESMTACQYMDKTTVPDGYGGVIPSWKNGAEFQAAIVLDTSIEARRAEQEGVKNLYTITTTKGVSLGFGDIVQRLEDGKYFRITSDGTDKKTPASAGLNMRQVTAEYLKALPDGSANG